MNKTLGLLSVSRKGGNLVYGEEQVGAAARAGHARLVLLANDAGDHTVRRAKSFVAGTEQPLLTVPFSKETLGGAVGAPVCAVAAVTDVRLAQAVVRSLDDLSHAALLKELDARVQRVEKRRAEEKAHRRNVRAGKKQSRERTAPEAKTVK